MRMPWLSYQVQVPLLNKIEACIKRRTPEAMELFLRTLGLEAFFRCFGPKRG